MTKKTKAPDFEAIAEQILMTGAGKGMKRIKEEVAMALADAYAAGMYSASPEQSKPPYSDKK